jgi:hypothetical protein
MAETMLFPGVVEWSGENPGISLKTDADGPFTALASFFRVVLSPHGRGHALVLLESPQQADAPGNLCLTDNEPLARWLIAEYVSHFAAWRGLPGLAGLRFQAIDSVTTEGDAITAYAEVIRAGATTVRLGWRGLGAPFCFAHPPERSSTGKHYMPNVFLGCESATIELDGRTLPGKPVAREVAGHRISTAMLAFSETWIRA